MWIGCVLCAAVVCWLVPGTVAAQSADQKKLLAEADTIAHRVSQLRGLAIRRPIKRGVMNKKQITERLLKRVSEEYKPDEIASEELAMKRLGLIAPDVKYLDLVIHLLTEQIAGFYDPWEKQLYIADWITMGQDAIMAHEITHALQDQHFQLKKWMTADKKNADATLARQALVEGDGLALMIEFSSPSAVPWGQEGFVDNIAGMMAMGMVTLGDVPLVLREGLVFPYLGGLRLVAQLRKTQPWKAVDAVYAKPPLSTEHIMHPRTYIEYERPVPVRPAQPSALKGFKVRYDNVMGQLGWSVFLRQHKVGEITARIAAAGWGGDRIAIYSPPGAPASDPMKSIAVMYTVWDSEVDAVEFYTAADDALATLAGAAVGNRPAVRPHKVEHRSSGGSVMLAERRGDAVLLVIGPIPGSTAGFSEEIWKTWKPSRTAARP